MEANSRINEHGFRKWRAMTAATIMGLFWPGSFVDGQVGNPPPVYPTGNSRPGLNDDVYRNTANSATTAPPRSAYTGSDELRRLQVEMEALTRIQEGLADDPISPAGDNSVAERARLKERLIELIDKLKSSSRSVGGAPKSQPLTADQNSDSRPVDRLKQAESLFRAGEVRSAQKVLQSIEPASLNAKQSALARYLRASCCRRLGDYEQARQIYREIAASKDDAFLAESAAWQLQAIRSREDMAAQIAPTRTPSTPK
jgi:tetratricopeptide (TPR) repeat protein